VNETIRDILERELRQLKLFRQSDQCTYGRLLEELETYRRHLVKLDDQTATIELELCLR